MRRKSSKIIGLVLAIILCISMLPTTVFAMQLYVTVQTSGNSITIDVEPAYTIAQVKSKIKEKGYSIEQTELYYNNQLLEDSKTLADYNIQKEATLTLVSASYTITNALFVSAGTLGISQDMLQWSDVDAPGGYKLEIYTESGTQVYTGTLTNNYTPASEVLTSSGTYYFTVYALDANSNELSSKTSSVFTYSHTHSYEAVVTAPTCTENGFTTYTCSVCGDSYTADETDATGHRWGGTEYLWSSDMQTCTATRTCQNDSSHVDVAYATVTGVEKKAATCTEDGEITYTGSFSVDWATQQQNMGIIAATGHSWGATVYTWSDDGKSCTATRTCETDSSHVEESTATVTGEETKAATCTGNGETTYTAVFSESWASEQTKVVADISATGHSWDEGTVTTAATSTTSGVKTYTCTECGETYTEEIQATGSTEDNSDATTSPQTGDNSHLWLWIVLILSGGSCMICISSVRRKRNR